MKSHNNIPKPTFILILFSTMILTSCTNKSTTNNETKFEELFELVETNHQTYKDIAPVELPSLLFNLNNDKAKDAIEIANSFNDFFESSNAFIPKGRISKSITTECYGNGIGSVCTYRWKEDDLYITAVDFYTADYFLMSIYYKGTKNGHNYPGDLNNPDDYGYLVQYHAMSTDAKEAIITNYRYPDSPPEYATEPQFMYSFKAEGDETIYTPWGSSKLTTYIYTSIIYDYIPETFVHISNLNMMTCKPNGDIEWEIDSWSIDKHKLYKFMVYFYDYSENKFSWEKYDDDGHMVDWGPK